jgi:hypothetical protein
LLLGLKGTMSEYELSLMRQRGIAARDSKAKRGEFRFMLPRGVCWGEGGKIEIDPDEHVADTTLAHFAHSNRDLATCCGFITHSACFNIPLKKAIAHDHCS